MSNSRGASDGFAARSTAPGQGQALRNQVRNMPSEEPAGQDLTLSIRGLANANGAAAAAAAAPKKKAQPRKAKKAAEKVTVDLTAEDSEDEIEDVDESGPSRPRGLVDALGYGNLDQYSADELDTLAEQPADRVRRERRESAQGGANAQASTSNARADVRQPYKPPPPAPNPIRKPFNADTLLALPVSEMIVGKDDYAYSINFESYQPFHFQSPSESAGFGVKRQADSTVAFAFLPVSMLQVEVSRRPEMSRTDPGKATIRSQVSTELIIKINAKIGQIDRLQMPPSITHNGPWVGKTHALTTSTVNPETEVMVLIVLKTAAMQRDGSLDLYQPVFDRLKKTRRPPQKFGALECVCMPRELAERHPAASLATTCSAICVPWLRACVSRTPSRWAASSSGPRERRRLFPRPSPPLHAVLPLRRHLRPDHPDRRVARRCPRRRSIWMRTRRGMWSSATRARTRRRRARSTGAGRRGRRARRRTRARWPDIRRRPRRATRRSRMRKCASATLLFPS